MQIELTPEIKNILGQIAMNQGIKPEILAMNIIREKFLTLQDTETKNEKQETLADFLEGYTGVLSSSEYVPGGSLMSEKCGEKFTKILLKKQQMGHI